MAKQTKRKIIRFINLPVTGDEYDSHEKTPSGDDFRGHYRLFGDVHCIARVSSESDSAEDGGISSRGEIQSE